MKKILYLLVIPTLALTGCSNKISLEETERIGEEIKNTDVNYNAISDLKVKYVASAKVEGTRNTRVVDNKQDESSTLAVSQRFKYIHMVAKMTTNDGVEQEKDITESETWIYMKNKMLYKVKRDVSKGTETKRYTKIEKYSEAINTFATEYNKNMADAVTNAKGDLFNLSDNVNKYIDSKQEGKFTCAVSSYSSGSGNLRYVCSLKFDQYESGDFMLSGVGTATGKWNKFLLKNFAFALTLTETDGTNKNNLKLNVGVTAKVSKFFIPTYPNLNSYAYMSQTSFK